MCLSGWHPGHSAVLSLSHGRPVWPVEQRVESTAALPAGQTIIIRLYRWPLPALPHSSSNVFRSQHLSSTWLPSPWWRFSPGRLLCISSAWTREVRWFLWISWMLLGSVCPGLTTQEIPSQTSLQLQNFNQQVYLVSWTFRCETSDGWDVFVCSPWKQLHHPPGVQLIRNPTCTSALWHTCLALIIWLLFVFIFLSSSSEQKFCQILSPSFYFYSFFFPSLSVLSLGPSSVWPQCLCISLWSPWYCPRLPWWSSWLSDAESCRGSADLFLLKHRINNLPFSVVIIPTERKEIIL